MGNNRRFYVFFSGWTTMLFRRFLAVAMGAVMSYKKVDEG
jgi:hypothetical protein